MKSTLPKFIVFEGLDGSGKSTCAKSLAKKIGAEFMTTPQPRIREFRDELISSFNGCQEACQLFYLSTVFAASAEVAGMLAKGKSAVLDRYFLSTQAYAAFRGSRLIIDSIEQHLTRPDVTVFLDVPLDVRRRRLEGRGDCSSADKETLGDKADAILREEHTRRSTLSVMGRFVCVDGVGDPEEVVARIRKESMI